LTLVPLKDVRTLASASLIVNLYVLGNVGCLQFCLEIPLTSWFLWVPMATNTRSDSAKHHESKVRQLVIKERAVKQLKVKKLKLKVEI